MSGPLTRHRHNDTKRFQARIRQGLPGWASAMTALLWLLASPLAMALPADAPVGRVELGAPKDQADATIACMYPMTGRSASYGRDSIVAIRLALQELARDPHSPHLRVIVDDSRSKASFAVRMAEDFLRNDDADILCGIVSSGVGMAVSDSPDRNRSSLSVPTTPRPGPPWKKATTITSGYPATPGPPMPPAPAT